MSSRQMHLQAVITRGSYHLLYFCFCCLRLDKSVQNGACDSFVHMPVMCGRRFARGFCRFFGNIISDISCIIKNVQVVSIFAHVLCKIKNNSLMFCDLLVEIRSKNGYRSIDPDRSKGKQRQNKVYEDADRLGKISGYMLWIQIFCQQHRSRKPDLYIPVFLHVSAEAVYAGFPSGRRASFLLNIQNNS